MISLFQSLHAITRRGDDLRPELCGAMENGEAQTHDEPAERSAAAEELARRRDLATAWAEREIKRKAYLGNLMQTSRDIEELRMWAESREV